VNFIKKRRKNKEKKLTKMAMWSDEERKDTVWGE
jgi:hypothetical protein